MDKQQLGDKAISILGAGVGATLGLFGGPPGAVAGGVLGTAFTEILRDVTKRMLSDREKLRVDNASTYIAEGIVAKLKDGAIVRQDGFFQGSDNFTSNGAELLEGVLMKCKEQYQERKLAFISNIFKNVAFDPTISAMEAYQALSLAEGLTYQKLCLLSYYGSKADFADFKIFNDPMTWYPLVTFPLEMQVRVEDLLEMSNQGVLISPAMIPDATHIMPGKMKLTVKGQRAFDLMELRQVASTDVLDAIAPLEYQASWGQSTNKTINGMTLTPDPNIFIQV